MDYKAILNSVQENQNELHHYGVLGMKWGQHRAKRNTSLPSLQSGKGINNSTFSRLTKASKKFVRDYNHDAKIDAKSVGANYRRVNRYGKKYIKTVGKEYKKAHYDVDFKNVNQGIAVSSRTGLFKYDNPANPTRRDYAQYLGRDAHVLSKMSREAMVSNLKSGDGRRVTDGYVEALARRYGKGALTGMRNQKLGTAAAVGGVAAGVGLAGAGVASLSGAMGSVTATSGAMTGVMGKTALGVGGWGSGWSTALASSVGVRGIKGMDYADNARNNSGRYRRLDRMSTSKNMNSKFNTNKPLNVKIN